MKSVTTREIQQNTRAIRQRLESGETLQWTIRGRVVGHLKPVPMQNKSVDWGDPLQRLQSIDKSSNASTGVSAAEQIYQDRG